jgi:hypothetical protein
MKHLAAGGQVHQLKIYSNLNLDCVDRVFLLSDDADLLAVIERASAFIAVHGWRKTRFSKEGECWYFDVDGLDASAIRFLNHDSFDDLRQDLFSHARSMNIEEGGLIYVAAGRINGRHKFVAFLVHHLIVDAITIRDLVNYCISGSSAQHLSDFISAPSFASFSEHLHSLRSLAESESALIDLLSGFRSEEGLRLGSGETPGATPSILYKEHSFIIETSREAFDNFCSQLNLWPREALISLFLLSFARCVGAGSILLGMCTPSREDAEGRALFQRTLGFLAVPTPVIMHLPDQQSDDRFLEDLARQWVRNGECQHLGAALAFTQNSGGGVAATLIGKLSAPEVVFNYYGELNEFRLPQIEQRLQLGSFTSCDNRKRNKLQIGMFRSDSGFLFELLFDASSIPPATIGAISAGVRAAAGAAITNEN